MPLGASALISAKRAPWQKGITVRSAQIGRQGRFRSSSSPLRPGLRIVAYRGSTTDDSVVVPLDAFKILQVNRAASKDTCVKAFEKLVKTAPEAEFSQDTLYARALVLKNATDTLTDSASRRQYDRLQELELAYSDLPGAMVLLLEAGEPHTVLEWGRAWLSDAPRNTRTRDVVMAMALSMCDMAALKMQGSKPATIEAYDLMRDAVKLLKEYHVGLNLQNEIQRAIKDMEPHLASHELALELDNPRRVHGLGILLQLVKGSHPEAWASGAQREQFLTQVKPHLTASEQVQVFEATLRTDELTAEARYEAALAYICAGFGASNPAHILRAEKLLRDLQDHPAGKGESKKKPDVSVALAVSRMLLGRPEDAEAALGLTKEATVIPDPAVQKFVLDASDGADDLIPGLCALSESWLAEFALPSFRTHKVADVSMTTWFSSHKVNLYLKVWEGPHHAVSDFKNAVLAQLQQGARAVAIAVFAALAACWTFLSTPLKCASHWVFRGNAAQLKSFAPEPKRTGPIRQKVNLQPATAPSGLGAPITSEGSLDMSKLEGATVGEIKNTRAEVEAEPQQDPITAGIVPLPMEREMWQSFNDPKHTARLKRLLLMIFVVICAGIAVILRRNPAANEAQMAMLTTLQSSMSKVLSGPRKLVGYLAPIGAEAPLTTQDAKEVLKQWQEVKKRALGSNHDAADLSKILTGRMLDEWKDRAANLQADGWYFEYAIKKLQVDDVITADNGRTARITATIKELVKLYSSPGQVHDQDVATYTTEFSARRTRDGVWKIFDSTVTGVSR